MKFRYINEPITKLSNCELFGRGEAIDLNYTIHSVVTAFVSSLLSSIGEDEVEREKMAGSNFAMPI